MSVGELKMRVERLVRTVMSALNESEELESLIRCKFDRGRDEEIYDVILAPLVNVVIPNLEAAIESLEAIMKRLSSSQDPESSGGNRSKDVCFYCKYGQLIYLDGKRIEDMEPPVKATAHGIRISMRRLEEGIPHAVEYEGERYIVVREGGKIIIYRMAGDATSG